MATFVISDQLNLLLRTMLRPPLWSHGDFIFGVFQHTLCDQTFAFAGGEQRSLVNQVGQISTRKSRCAFGNPFEVNIVSQGYIFGMNAQNLLPPLYIAYSTELSEGTEVFHNDIRGRFHRGEPKILDAMQEWAELSRQVRDHLVRNEGDRIGSLLNRNFDLRREIYQISRGNLEMIDTARSTGASAKFTGSGGAIVGTYDDDAMFEELAARLSQLGAKTFKPQVVAEA